VRHQKTKSFITLLCVFILFCVSLIGCDDNTRQYEFSDYDNDNKMYIGAFSSPLPTQQSYEEFAEAGFNYVLMDEDNGNKRGSALQEATLGYCNYVGVTALVMSFNFQGVHDENVDNTDYSKFPAYGGEFFYDEPWPDDFDYIKNEAIKFSNKYSDKIFMCNLHSCEPFIDQWTECFCNGKQYTYEEYLSEYIDGILSNVNGPKYLSVDLYPLLDGRGRDNQILREYLYNLEATAKLTRGTDIIQHYFILTHGYNKRRAPASLADITFQYYSAMAYGVKAFSCFTYKQQKSKEYIGFDGMLNWQVNSDGSYTSYTTDIYDYVKEANEYLRSFENVYLSFDWKKTMAVKGSESVGENYCYAMLTENAVSLNNLKHVSASQDTLIGYFKDAKNNTDGYMITNFSEPSKNLTDDIELLFENHKKVRIYQKGKCTEQKLTKGKLSLSLTAGDGAFVIAV